MTKEKTVIIVKHDGVARGLMGQIIKRFERVGLKLVALEFLKGTEDMGNSHYPNSNEWYEKVGKRTLAEYKEKGINAKKELGTDDPIEIGKLVKKWNVDYLTAGPVLAMIWEGPGAVKIGRKLVGETLPANAAPGTIRGDFSIDNAELANNMKRPFYNLVHASGEVAEAEEEIALWFENVEVYDYDTFSWELMGMKHKLTR